MFLNVGKFACVCFTEKTNKKTSGFFVNQGVRVIKTALRVQFRGRVFYEDGS